MSKQTDAMAQYLTDALASVRRWRHGYELAARACRENAETAKRLRRENETLRRHIGEMAAELDEMAGQVDLLPTALRVRMQATAEADRLWDQLGIAEEVLRGLIDNNYNTESCDDVDTYFRNKKKEQQS